MPTFERKYTDDQRDAIYAGWKDEEWTVPEICRRAKEGTLLDLPRFDLPTRTARDIIARRLMQEVKRGAASAGSESVVEIVGRLIAVASAEADRLSTQQKAGELDAKNFREFVRSIADLAALQKQASTRAPRRGEDGEEEEESSLVSELSEAAAAEPANGAGSGDDDSDSATSPTPGKLHPVPTSPGDTQASPRP